MSNSRKTPQASNSGADVFTLDTLRGLFRHMEWADAAVWQSVLACPNAASDSSIRDRLYHIHLVQHAFFHIWSARPLDLPQVSAFKDLGALVQWARGYHEQVAVLLESIDSAALQRTIAIPWAEQLEKQFARPIQGVTFAETMLQVTSHSTYHRGQINARLREVGGEPPLVDFIAWIWLGRPAAGWPADAGPGDTR